MKNFVAVFVLGVGLLFSCKKQEPIDRNSNNSIIGKWKLKTTVPTSSNNFIIFNADSTLEFNYPTDSITTYRIIDNMHLDITYPTKNGKFVSHYGYSLTNSRLQLTNMAAEEATSNYIKVLD